MRSKDNQAVEVNKPSRAKEKRVGVWDFKKKEDNSHGN